MQPPGTETPGFSPCGSGGAGREGGEEGLGGMAFEMSMEEVLEVGRGVLGGPRREGAGGRPRGTQGSVRLEKGGREEGEGRVRGRRRPRRALGMSYGAVSLQGARANQEDQYTAIPDLAGVASGETGAAQGLPKEGQGEQAEMEAFYAIYDGHCGIGAARYAQQRTHHYLMADPLFVSSPEAAMVNVCRRLDKEVLEMCEQEGLYCGTTAILTFFRGRTVYVGNVGDCAAILCRDGKAFPLSSAQTPGRKDERERIERANGWVTEEMELFIGQLHRMDLADPSIAEAVDKKVAVNTIHRVCGNLSVSRSIGDPDFKGFSPHPGEEGLGGTEAGEAGEEDSIFAFPPGHSGVFHGDLVIADPETRQITVSEADAFLLVACDGFWDVVDEEEAVAQATGLLAGGLGVSDVAAQLGNLALRLGSSDNVTVVLVVFEHWEEEGEEGAQEEQPGPGEAR
ncbi:protein phosphatase 1e [Nannochloropsis gaditana]|uniref:Protein phosphatase 1e n=2 Tax=Nannochloropsis gaditana TaxID=72520 RepID=W7TA28_9STRA|nr:protein phosphatase 1e [Nannochloropsis gaditana]